MAEDRLPPQDLNAEQSVVGCMLLDKNAIIRVVEMLRPDSFYRDAHRYIFEAILNLFDKNEPVDIVTVTAELRKTDRLDSVGGSVYISDLLNCVPTAANVEYYAKIVAEKAVLRRLIEAGTKIVAEAFEDPENVDAVLDDAEKSIFEIALKRSRQGFQKIDALLKSVLNKIDQLYGKKESLIGIPTGYPDLDSMTGGLQNSELIIIAARFGRKNRSRAQHSAECSRLSINCRWQYSAWKCPKSSQPRGCSAASPGGRYAKTEGADPFGRRMEKD